MRNYVKEFLHRYAFDDAGAIEVLRVFDAISDENVNRIVNLYQDETSFDFSQLTALIKQLSEQMGIHEYLRFLIHMVVHFENLKSFFLAALTE